MAKIKTITLQTWERAHRTEPRLERIWWVIKVTDSTEFVPNQELDKKTVDSLCDSTSWKVTIYPRTD